MDNRKYFWKFVICSLIGVIIFIIPVPYDGTFSIVAGMLTDLLEAIFEDILSYIVLAIVCLSGIMSLVGTLFKPKFIMESEKLKSLCVTTPLYLISRMIGVAVCIMVVFDFGPEFILSGDTGGTMVGLTKTLVCIILSISYFMPLLTDFGIMEYVGVRIRKAIRPLFTVPGRSAIDLITSWLGAANAAVLLTNRQYETGFYSAREAAIIMTNFSLVSVPFCLLVAGTLDITNMFVPMFLTVTLVGVILAIIVPRIPPLSRIPDTYATGNPKIKEDIPEGISMKEYALQLAVKRAANTTAKDVIKAGNDMLLGVWFNMTPVVIAWGTIALIIATYTPFFDIISYPMGMLLDLMNVEYAFEAAPATLVGFTDMFIPALLAANIPSAATRFIIACLSLEQIVFLTEVGVIAIQSRVPLNLGNLFIIFMERTLLSLPLFVLVANLLY